MATKDPLKALEELNAKHIELLKYEAPEYVLGRRIGHFKENFPFHIFQWIRNYLQGKKTQQLSDELCHYVQPADFFYACPKPVTSRKGVVYSCITNGYDVPKAPILVNETLDYILYTDAEERFDSVWKYKKIKEIENTPGSNFANRYYKFNPFSLFPDYDYSIYVDGNVQVVSDVTGLYSIANESPLGIAMHKHFSKSCAYKDAKWCELNKRGKLTAIKEQVRRYRKEGFPEEYGLCEATIIVVDLHSPVAKKIMNVWWQEFCRTESGRDQISFPYVLWKMGYKISDVGCLGNDEYHNPKFIINAHTGKLI